MRHGSIHVQEDLMTWAPVFAALAGLCSGTWPILMRQTGLGTHLIPLAFSLGTLVVTLPFAIAWSLRGAGVPSSIAIQWQLLVPAALFGSGVLVFVAAMLMHSTPATVGVNLLVLALVQITVPAIYTMYMAGASIQNVLGCMLAYTAVVVLAGPRWA
jgi:hypothetical protein